MDISTRNSISAGLRMAFGCLLAAAMIPSSAFAHGIAGSRFFPTTFAVDDPFVSDEFSVLYGYRKQAGEEGGPRVESSALSAEFSKRITPALGISFGDEYQSLRAAGVESLKGFGNLEVAAKYQFYTNAEHETVLSFGVSDEIGGTGSRRAGSEDFSVISPAIFFGKGLGDLPDSAKYLRPFAVTGFVGPDFSSRPDTVTVDELTGDVDVERHPTTLSWAITLQYSLLYLQTVVEDVGLEKPFNRMVAVVEFPMETCLNRGCDGQTTGTANPGFVWVGKRVELGVAAQIPVNDRSGSGVGVLALLHVFLDDLFPKSIGRPLFP